jgi:diguanylate cyclase (GGDEF)-like protein/PAS domain S-box-containing protein
MNALLRVFNPWSTATAPTEPVRHGEAVDQAMEGRVRAQQIAAVLQTTPVTVMANGANMAILGVAYHGLVMPWLMWGWILAVTGVCLFSIRAWWRWRGGLRFRSASTRAMRRATMQATALGGLWGLAPAALFPLGGGGNQILVASITTGMICGGGFMLAPVPRAALGYMGALTLGGVAALLLSASPTHVYLALLLAVYLVAVVAGVLSTSRNLRARLIAEAQAEQQHQLIGLLLRDFEENASDVLWEIDAAGRLRHASNRLSQALGVDDESLRGKKLMSLLAVLQSALPEAERVGIDALRQRFVTGEPFRDVVVALSVERTPRWWSITAKPLMDAQGVPIGWRGVARDVSESRMADRRLAFLAHHDTLTGLANRHHFRQALEAALGGAGAPGSAGEAARGAVLCLDLDNFKAVNDKLGHATGDALLAAIGRRLRHALKGPDLVARLGGDEFGVLLRGVHDVSEVEAIARRLIDTLQEPCEVQGSCITPRCSVGIARFPDDGQAIDELLQCADLALYDAKSNAPGTWRFFASRLGAQTRRRLLLEQDLRDALAKGELRLQFQPQVDMRRWEVTGFEALLRWRHPVHGEVPPSEFIPVAEASGLIPAIGDWVLEQACRAAAQWPLAVKVSVNISPVQVMNDNLSKVVRRALSASGLAPQRLELEITESVFLGDVEGTRQRLHTLRRLGVRVALDDFGTGYSSLAYLRRFPFDTLKIDRAFVRELLISRDARSIVRTIVGLAGALRMTAIAEGVEEPAQVKVLEDEGCHAIQGFLVSHAIEGDKVAPFLNAWAFNARPVPASDFSLGVTMPADFSHTQPPTTTRSDDLLRLTQH